MTERISTKSKLIINGAVLLLVGGLYLGIWYWDNRTLASLAQRQNARAGAEGGPVDVQEAAQALESAKNLQIQTEGYVLADDEVVGFIEQIEKLAHDAGVEETTDAVSAIVYPGLPAAEWGGLQVVLSTKGSWADTYQFLSLLERIPYKSSVVQSVIEQDMSQGEEQKGLGWVGTFTIKVLRKK